jgi:flagellin-like hook-associated protein FlgL
MTSPISLTAGTRQNLLLLQQTSSSLQDTQLRLATGNKINSALDGPTSFFAAQSLNQRAGDLDALKDGMGQAISTLNGANTGITQIQDFLQQAQGLTTQALSSLGTDTASVALRNNLATQYNTILRNIDKAAQDASYAGKNLLVGSGLSLDATQSTKQDVNTILGISGATATNVTSADQYTIAVKGDGAISGSTADVQTAQEDRGISNLQLTGFDSTTFGNFDSVSIKLAGGKGKDKTFTITEGDQSKTLTFTQAQWTQANAAGNVLHASVSFDSGTRVNFDVNFKDIENTPDTAGVGTSTIEKLVNLQVSATNKAGETVTRDGLNPLGQGKTANGENAFSFDSGTARVTVDERQIVQGSTYDQAVSSPYGTGAGAITATPTASGTITADAKISLTAAGSGYNYATNSFDSYDVQLTSSNTAGGGSTTAVHVSAGNASDVTVSADQITYNMGLDTNELSHIATAAAADSTEITSTAAQQTTGGFGNTSVTLTLNASVGGTDATGFAKGQVTNVTYTLTATTNSTGTISFDDGQGGTTTVKYTGADSVGGATVVSATLSGGANDGAHVQLTLDNKTSASITAGDTISGSFKVRGTYDSTDATGNKVQANFDVRAARTGQSGTLETKQLVDGNDGNNLTVQLNETNTSTVTVVSQNVQTDGQGLKLDQAQNGWNDRADIQNAIDQLNAATTSLRGASSSLSTNLNIIQTRETFTADFSNVLTEGAGKLTLADQNEEGANILTLQTRQQLGTISLSLANQAQQAILRLF